MGLDQYLYRPRKPEMDPAKVYDYESLMGFCIEEEDLQNTDTDMFRAIIPYCTRITVRKDLINFERLKQDYGMKDCFIAAITGDAYWFHGKKNSDGNDAGEKTEIKIPWDTMCEKYSIESVKPALFCELERVHYWRKNYSVSHWFEDVIGLIENTGYYRVDEDMVEDYNHEFPEDPITEEGPFLYHEWW